MGEIRKKAEEIAAKSFFNCRFCGRAGKMRIDIRGFEYYNINTYKNKGVILPFYRRRYRL